MLTTTLLLSLVSTVQVDAARHGSLLLDRHDAALCIGDQHTELLAQSLQRFVVDNLLQVLGQIEQRSCFWPLKVLVAMRTMHMIATYCY